MRGIFITGTDTNVGKTVVAAAVMLRYRDEAPLQYWKPVQTGIEQDDDTREVVRLSHARDHEVLRCNVRLPGPLSPHLAARRAGARITVQSLLEPLHAADLRVRAAHEPRIPNPESRLCRVVEGAGGALVPLNERETMADLMQALDMPVLIAARSTLGTINHTCMTIEVLRRRMLRVAGVVMVGEPNDENRLAIERYGAAEVLGQMPRFDPLTPEALRAWARAELDPSGVLFVGALR
jgi:dethiobiotin synthase